MLSEAERIAILRYVRSLRLLARDDKLQADRTPLPIQRERYLIERRRRLKEAWRWRRHEREFRESTIRAELLKSQLWESIRLEAR